MSEEIEKVFTERGFTNIEQMATMFDYYKQEIERLKEENKKYNKWIESLNKDNHRLNNIIKEVREYIENTHYYSEVINEEYLLKEELLEILDKGE